jgi:hypothetical protein
MIDLSLNWHSSGSPFSWRELMKRDRLHLGLELLETREVPAVYVWNHSDFFSYGQADVLANWRVDGQIPQALPDDDDDLDFTTVIGACEFPSGMARTFKSIKAGTIDIKSPGLTITNGGTLSWTRLNMTGGQLTFRGGTFDCESVWVSDSVGELK